MYTNNYPYTNTHISILRLTITIIQVISIILKKEF